MRVIRVIVLVAVVAIPAALRADPGPLRPYEKPGVMSPGFGERLRQAREPFSIQFSNGKTFHGVRRFKSGTNVLLTLPNRRLLRLPSDHYTQPYIPSWAKAHGLLKRSRVPIPELYLAESDPNEYLVEEQLPVEFTFAELGKAPAADRARHYAKLVDFMKTTWQYRAIGDFGVDQLGWVGDRWVLLDFTHYHVPLRLSDGAGAQHAISSTQAPPKLFHLPDHVRRAVDEVMMKRRAKEFRTGRPALISAEEHGLPDEIEDY